MKQYLKIKESGVDWIGEIPEHWNTKKLKFTCIVNPPKSEVNNLPDNFKISFLPMDKIGEDGKLTLDEIKNLAEVKNGFTYFRDGDVIVAKITPCFENGKGSLCNELENGVGFGTTELHVLRPQKEFDPLFTFYWTRSDPFMQTGESLMYGAAGQKRIPTEFIKDFVIAYPKLIKEQETIAKFLKNQSTQIDEDIKKNQKLIGLLKEKRNTLINQAVTTGLDSSVPMKDSGIEWIGKIPEHWIMRKVKNSELFSISSGDFIDYTDSGQFPVYGSNGLIGSYHKYNSENIIVVGRVGQYAGSITFVPEKACVTDNGLIIKPGTKINLRFLFYTFTNLDFNRFANKTAQPLITQGILSKFQFPLPPELEQKSISKFLDSKLEQHDSLISKTESQIQKFQEYRQSLISVVVTGKVDVRQEVVA